MFIVSAKMYHMCNTYVLLWCLKIHSAKDIYRNNKSLTYYIFFDSIFAKEDGSIWVNIWSIPTCFYLEHNIFLWNVSEALSSSCKGAFHSHLCIQRCFTTAWSIPGSYTLDKLYSFPVYLLDIAYRWWNCRATIQYQWLFH